MLMQLFMHCRCLLEAIAITNFAFIPTGNMPYIIMFYYIVALVAISFRFASTTVLVVDNVNKWNPDERVNYSGVIMGVIASQITSLTIVYSAVYSGADQRKHQSSASLAFVRGIHRWPGNSPHKWPVTRKMFRFDYVIMWSVFFFLFRCRPINLTHWGPDKMAAIFHTTFRIFFLNENAWIAFTLSLKFVPKGPINNIPELVHIIAWGRIGDKPWFEPIVN